MEKNEEKEAKATWLAWCEGCGQRSENLLKRRDTLVFLLRHWLVCDGKVKRGRVYRRVLLHGEESDVLDKVHGEGPDPFSEFV